MGCGYSTEFEILVSNAKFLKWKKHFEALKLCKHDQYLLYLKFKEIDLDHSGFIDSNELLTVLDIERTPFCDKIFQVFDNDGSGKIDFHEFVLSLWNFNTLSNHQLAEFAFCLYDRDNSKVLEKEDIKQLMYDVYGRDAAKNPRVKLIEHDLETFIQKQYIPNLDLPNFLTFVEYHQSLLLPASMAQFSLRSKVIGEKFWLHCMATRKEISGTDAYLPILKILELGINLQRLQQEREENAKVPFHATKHPPPLHEEKEKEEEEDELAEEPLHYRPTSNQLDHLHNHAHPNSSAILPTESPSNSLQLTADERTEMARQHRAVDASFIENKVTKPVVFRLGEHGDSVNRESRLFSSPRDPHHPHLHHARTTPIGGLGVSSHLPPAHAPSHEPSQRHLISPRDHHSNSREEKESSREERRQHAVISPRSSPPQSILVHADTVPVQGRDEDPNIRREAHLRHQQTEHPHVHFQL